MTLNGESAISLDSFETDGIIAMTVEGGGREVSVHGSSRREGDDQDARGKDVRTWEVRQRKDRLTRPSAAFPRA
jgi:hypothetical protein